MGLINADTLIERVEESRRDNPHRNGKIAANHIYEHDHFIDMIIETPIVDAEPVRHEGNTTFISTYNLEGYADRIIVEQGKFCKIYYSEESERRGCWIGLEYDGYADGYPVYDLWECSECRHEHKGEDTPNYCPNCGSKMDLEVKYEQT